MRSRPLLLGVDCSSFSLVMHVSAIRPQRSENALVHGRRTA